MARKPLELKDHNLWDEVKRSIKPLNARGKKSTVSKTVMLQIAIPKPLDRVPEFRPLHHHAPPPLASFDRRTAQKLSRGKSDPESRIDLHGENIENARIKLLHFLQNQYQQGVRLVLVITGKGASPYSRHTLHGREAFHTPEREGRLRREVPDWLHDAVFRSIVVGYQPAHPKHGGGGAFYVRLRRHGPSNA